ncbi:hypothetical protein GCM10018790_69920 [Kitasatospora xanthocidica]|nr:hypothetical protein GCM10018790_69920 [Kitasatospora xanthocidica]
MFRDRRGERVDPGAGAACGTIGKQAAPAPGTVPYGRGIDRGIARTAAVGCHSTTSTALEVKPGARRGPRRGPPPRVPAAPARGSLAHGAGLRTGTDEADRGGR